MNNNWKEIFKKDGITPYISIDDKRHHYPHIHLSFAEYEVVVNLEDLSVIVGDDNFPANKKKIAINILKKMPIWLKNY
jgi:hypothetical protein